MDYIHSIKNYTQPVVNHPIFKTASFLVIETTKIAAAKTFLELLGTYCLRDHSKFLPNRIFALTVFAPVVEEILFRGLLNQGIHAIQWASNKGNLKEEDKKAQEVFRVRLSSLLFASAHLLNPHKSAMSALIQFTWSGIGGLAYGYLSEKYKTLSVGILAHGFNNTLATAAGMYPEISSYCLIAVLVNKIGFYILAITKIDTTIISGVYALFHFNSSSTHTGNTNSNFKTADSNVNPSQSMGIEIGDDLQSSIEVDLEIV